jgi:starch synthase
MLQESNGLIRVLFMAAEAAPLVKAGGLGDVTGSLPRALLNLPPNLRKGRSLDIRLAIPFHPSIPRSAASKKPIASFAVQLSNTTIPAQAYLAHMDGLPVYLIDGDPIPKEGGVYSIDTQKDGEKFTFFSLAGLELCRALDWQPDVIHAHDWHAALALHELVRRRETQPFFARTRGLITVHNLPYMGAGTDLAMRAYEIEPSQDTRLPNWGRYQPLPMGLSAADAITTVSPTYAREILTPEFGCGLESFLKLRADSLTGILNGLDMASWNPADDKTIPFPFSPEEIDQKVENKKALLEEFNLEYNPGLPLFILISRFDRQKGVDLAMDALRLVKDLPWQAILLGNGDPVLEESCRQLETEMPGRVRAAIRFDPALSRRLYAGGDMLLIPSRYEPCGLAQMIAMLYGALPIARATGGLVDTVFDLSDPHCRTGFLFKEANAASLAATLRRAVKAFGDPLTWRQHQRCCMQQDFSWQRSAAAYIQIYVNLLETQS